LEFIVDRNSDFSHIVGNMSESIGQFEQIILTAILSLRDEAYAVTIHEKAEEFAKPKRISPGAVYVTLDRLEDKGLITSWLSDPTPERGGRSKRYYRLEALGERALEESAATAKRVAEAVEEIWGGITEGIRRRPKWSPARPR
jgi:PadR family transcriptional regulator, regulatory protein PadR